MWYNNYERYQYKISVSLLSVMPTPCCGIGSCQYLVFSRMPFSTDLKTTRGNGVINWSYPPFLWIKLWGKPGESLLPTLCVSVQNLGIPIKIRRCAAPGADLVCPRP